MPATVTIRRWTGTAGAEVKTDITSQTTRASLSDNPNPGVANPIPIPAAGTNYSWWVSTRLSADTSPSGTINNIRWFSGGANNFGTGVTCIGADASTGTSAGYRQATASSADSGTQLTQVNHTGLDRAPADVFTYTSASPLSLGGSISNPAIGDFGDFFVEQIGVASTASPGVLLPATFSFRYDET